MLIVSLQKTITNQNFYFPFMSFFSVLSVLFFERKKYKKIFHVLRFDHGYSSFFWKKINIEKSKLYNDDDDDNNNNNNKMQSH